VEVAQFKARHATGDLVHPEFLSDDGLEQRTEYASRTQVKIRLPDPQNRDDQGGSLRSPENFDGVLI
jgi:hypothetical protein